MTEKLFPTCLKICSSDNYVVDRKQFLDNEQGRNEKSRCMFTCSQKFYHAESICKEAIKEHNYYNNHVTIKNKAKHDENKKIEALINKLF